MKIEADMPGKDQISFRERLTGAFIGLGVCIASAPIALVLTIVLMPAWSWLEKTMAIEAVGHSGPAEWCYLFVYIIVISVAGVVWSMIRQRRE